jgi:transposase
MALRRAHRSLRHARWGDLHGLEWCPRWILTERLPEVVAPWARRTRRLVAWLIALGLALGGAAGVRLSRRLGCTLSRQTLRRSIRCLPLAGDRTPRALGVNEFALRTRQTSGTVRIDRERRQPVALWPDREAATLAPWLRAHPGVEVITRDRASA